MKINIWLIFVLITIGILVFNIGAKKEAFHREASQSACEAYAADNTDDPCQTTCWQHTSSIQDCMAANGYAGLSDNIGYWYEYHSSNGANCKAALEWEMVQANYAPYDRVIASVKCITTLQAYGAVVPTSCVPIADVMSSIASWKSSPTTTNMQAALNKIGAYKANPC